METHCLCIERKVRLLSIWRLFKYCLCIERKVRYLFEDNSKSCSIIQWAGVNLISSNLLNIRISAHYLVYIGIGTINPLFKGSALMFIIEDISTNSHN